MDEPRRPHSLFFPLLLVTAGIFFLLANLGKIDNTIWGIIAVYWPLLFIIGGLDHLYRRRTWVGPLVSIGLGTVLLLGNLHYLQWSSLDLLLRLWPILLIAWGLDIVFGHEHSVWNTAARIALGLLLVLGIVWLAIASPFGSGIRTQHLTQTLDNASSSNLNFSMAAGEMTLAGGAAKNDLIDGTIGVPKEEMIQPEYQEPVDGQSTFSLKGAGVVLVPVGTTAPWELKMTSAIPVEIFSQMGVGSQNIDLSGVNIPRLDSELAVGRLVLTLPEKIALNGEVQVPVGELVIRVPKGTHLVLHLLSQGAFTKQLPQGYTQNGNTIESAVRSGDVIDLNVNVGLGSLVVQEIPNNL